VTFTHETLGNPPRAFIDLRGVTASPALLDTTLDGDDTVRQVRVGRRPDATRVVLDLEASAKVSVFALYNPFRVVIDTARGAGAVVQVPVPAESPVLVADDSVVPGATAPLSAPFAVAPPPPAPGPAPAPPRPAARASAVPPPPVVPARATAPTPVREPAMAVADAGGTADDPEMPLSAVPSANTDGTFSMARQLGLGISRIVIDPGHGGHDPGTIANGAEEAEIVLDIALRLERLLAREPGLDVVLTRRTDVFVPLEQRTAIANRQGADLFLSIHANSSRNTSARGIETYFLSFASSPDAEAVAARENATSEKAMHNLPGIVRAIALNNKLDESRDLATMVQESMTTRLVRSNSGLRSRGVKKAPFVVLIGAGMPSVLAEVAFLTNRPEAALVKTPAYRQRVAEALHAAVMRYRKSLKRQTSVAAAR
jgi:N-acetylmuramoyl-L-alanine amidase